MLSDRRTAWLAAAALVLLTGCFDEPVSERVTLVFDEDGEVDVRVESRISPVHLEDANPRLERRLRLRQRMLREEWDDWPARFARARPATETLLRESAEGELLGVERTAHLDDPAALRPFFADALTALYTADGERAELALYATSSARATAGERQHVERRLGEWSAAYADYLASAGRLYAWLRANPARVRPVFERLLETDSDVRELEGEEGRLADDLAARMEGVAEVLLVPPDDAYTLNEIARRVYDPFPAPLEVRVPGEVLEVEGFAPAGPGRYVVPGLDLWSAARALEGRWISPDPVLAWVDRNRTNAPDLDLEAWLAAGLRATAPPPDATEVRRAVDELLEPAPVYRLAWRR